MQPRSPPSNIVLLTIDSLRADHIYTDIVDTPNIDRLREKDTAITFEQAFSQGPYTTFSMPSLFTSRYPSGLQYMEFSENTVGVYIDDEPTVTTVLSNMGYRTGGFHSNPLLSNLFGFNRGFDTFSSNLPFSNTDLLPGRLKILSDKLFRAVRTHAYLPAQALNDRAFEWLDNLGPTHEAPFFLWLHYMDAHGPYQSKSGNRYLNKMRGERLWRKAVNRPQDVTEAEHDRLHDLYCEEVRYVDDCIGDFVDTLQEKGLRDDTILILTADHGEQFREHGEYSHPHQLYDELTNVPLILDDPSGIFDSELELDPVDDIVELVDVAATIVSRVDGDIPSSFSGVPIIERDCNVAISESDLTPDYSGSVRTSEWRYIRDESIDVEHLFDLKSDSEESTDVSERYPEKLAELAKILDSHLLEEGRSTGTNRKILHEPIEDRRVKERLEDLGYR